MAFTTSGEAPVDGFSKAKARLDRLMLEELRSDRRAELAPFVLHDVRRTVRTRLSELRVPFEIAELVIGHSKKGIRRVYDRHEFLDEMREALDAWAQRLRVIVAKPEAQEEQARVRVVAQVGADTFLVRTRGRGRLRARGRIADLDAGRLFGELPLDSLLRAGYWEPVRERRAARRALRMARTAR